MTTATMIYGKVLKEKILDEIKTKLSQISAKRPPGLATVLVGHNAASEIYVTNKRKTAEKLGIKSFHYTLNQNTSQQTLLDLISELNHNQSIDGILVQLPLPSHIDESVIIRAIDPKKDVDGFHPYNMGLLFSGHPQIIPCTPKACLYMIQSCGLSIAGKHAIIVGRSNIVGKPMAHLLLKEDATITICHSKTSNLAQITKEADILIAAIGQAKMLNHLYIKKGAIVIDVGISRHENNKIVGDVDLEDVKHLAAFISPVPGGVGPMTIAMLMSNTLECFMRNIA